MAKPKPKPKPKLRRKTPELDCYGKQIVAEWEAKHKCRLTAENAERVFQVHVDAVLKGPEWLTGTR